MHRQLHFVVALLLWGTVANDEGCCDEGTQIVVAIGGFMLAVFGYVIPWVLPIFTIFNPFVDQVLPAANNTNIISIEKVYTGWIPCDTANPVTSCSQIPHSTCYHVASSGVSFCQCSAGYFNNYNGFANLTPAWNSAQCTPCPSHSTDDYGNFDRNNYRRETSIINKDSIQLIDDLEARVGRPGTPVLS
jgi:hypothetical protein